MTSFSAHNDTRPLEGKNDTEETVPSFGIALIEDVEDDGTLVLGKPTDDPDIERYVINGHVPILPGQRGEVSRDFPLWARFNQSDEPAIGDVYGPVDGEWHLDAGGTGLYLLSANKLIGEIDVVRVVLSQSVKVRLGKTTVAHDKGETEEVAIYSGETKGEETDTEETEDAYNRFADLATDKWVILMHVDGGWELIAGEC